MIEGLVTWGPEFELRFAMLDPNTIISKLLPEEDYVDRINEISGFYDSLEESILKEGFRNPIIVVAGWYPYKIDLTLPPLVAKKVMDDMIEEHIDKIYCLTAGGSRLWVAIKYELLIPCIVADYVGKFKNKTRINSTDEMMKYYTDKPSTFQFGMCGISAKNIQ